MAKAARRDSLDSKASTASTDVVGKEQRIPSMLQAVFIQSNRGKVVNRPPPGKLASRVFRWTDRKWFWKRGRGSKKAAIDSEPVKNSNEGAAKATKPAGKAKEAALPADFSLQGYLDSLLQERGYTTTAYDTLNTGYYTKATPMQIASYGPHMIKLVRAGDAEAIRATMKAGLSPNPCNQFGESLLHMICRHGSIEMIDVLIEAGASLQVSDDYGRTPLNDALWAPSPAFDVVSRILDKDSGMLFLRDKRGSLPLEYVRKSEWSVWRDWFDANIDKYFPASGAAGYAPPELAGFEPNSVALPEQKAIGLPLDLVKMIANGNMSPEEAQQVAHSLLHQDDDDPTERTDFDNDSFGSDYDSDDSSLYDDLDQEDMLEMLQIAQQSKPGSVY
eukprot:CAMPEP_0168774658 /NCGR_PEP_ID=MMETSP0725-20121227/5111_1 /TAXON_ID=265536 /ORGANISM="Amphiprora sp., Strain CCMP467" /LENGTH=388 /DNA_ID=CAMNT_0008824265 /DNA_START=118 /DNA_END=1284 /DNA_ORIENTATION=+